MLIKKNNQILNIRIIVIILFITLLLLLLSLFVPFNIYRNVGLFFINVTSNIHNYNETTLKENSYYKISHQFYNPLNIVLNYINSFSIERDKLEINLSMNDYQKLNYRIHLARKRGQINREDKNEEVPLYDMESKIKQREGDRSPPVNTTPATHEGANKESKKIKILDESENKQKLTFNNLIENNDVKKKVTFNNLVDTININNEVETVHKNNINEEIDDIKQEIKSIKDLIAEVNSNLLKVMKNNKDIE